MAGNTTGGAHPGMMGDGTEEQNLNQNGDPGAQITESEVSEAFGKGGDTKASGADKAAGAKTGDAGQVTKQVSNDMSDAKAAPQDKQPKDNSHNFT